jgi:uncharacterized membrane protein
LRKVGFPIILRRNQHTLRLTQGHVPELCTSNILIIQRYILQIKLDDNITQSAAVEGSQLVNGQSLQYLNRPYAGYLTFGIDIAAGIIIAISAATALIAFFKILRKSPKEQIQEKETSRLRLARRLLLALDFEVGSNILKTILVPSPNELSILAAVVVGSRIVLSWSLSKEIDRHNVDLLESGKQPIAGRKTTTIFS